MAHWIHRVSHKTLLVFAVVALAAPAFGGCGQCSGPEEPDFSRPCPFDVSALWGHASGVAIGDTEAAAQAKLAGREKSPMNLGGLPSAQAYKADGELPLMTVDSTGGKVRSIELQWMAGLGLGPTSAPTGASLFGKAASDGRLPGGMEFYAFACSGLQITYAPGEIGILTVQTPQAAAESSKHAEQFLEGILGPEKEE